MSDETTLLLCPFCGGEARLVNDYSIEKGMRYQIWHECTGHEGRSGGYGQGVKPFFETPWYPTDAEAIAAWNTRATCGTLTAEQVREAIERHVKFYEGGDYDEQVIADELNAMLESDAKPCYAADENYKRCKYSVNRGWCDDAPFLVWDDTGHLFITMGGLKTWDVTDDAKKWFAELGSGTCKITATATNNLMYPDYMTKWYELSCGHSLTLKGDEAPKWCAVCGKAVER